MIQWGARLSAARLEAQRWEGRGRGGGVLSGQIFCIIMMCSNINFSNVLQYQTASTSIASWVRTLTAAGQIFCIIMMCSAACFFGLVLGELQEIHAAANTTVPAIWVGSARHSSWTGQYGGA